MDGWSWLWHTTAGMIVGFVVAVGAWSAAAQAERSDRNEGSSGARDRRLP